MDIHGGKGICLGPNNWIGRGYQQSPVAITVEGANILTRTPDHLRPGRDPLPSLRAAGDAGREGDADAPRPRASSTSAFSHVGSRSAQRRARVRVRASPARTGSRVPANAAPENRHYYQQLTRLSAAFAFLAGRVDAGDGRRAEAQGEDLRRAWATCCRCMYLVSATLKRYEDEGRQPRRHAARRLGGRDALYHAQHAFDGMISNYPEPVRRVAAAAGSSSRSAWPLRRAARPRSARVAKLADRARRRRATGSPPACT